MLVLLSLFSFVVVLEVALNLVVEFNVKLFTNMANYVTNSLIPIVIFILEVVKELLLIRGAIVSVVFLIIHETHYLFLLLVSVFLTSAWLPFSVWWRFLCGHLAVFFLNFRALSRHVVIFSALLIFWAVLHKTNLLQYLQEVNAMLWISINDFISSNMGHILHKNFLS